MSCKKGGHHACTVDLGPAAKEKVGPSHVGLAWPSRLRSANILLQHAPRNTRRCRQAIDRHFNDNKVSGKAVSRSYALPTHRLLFQN